MLGQGYRRWATIEHTLVERYIGLHAKYIMITQNMIMLLFHLIADIC